MVLLLGLGFVRFFVRRFAPSASDSRLDTIYFIIFLVEIAVSWVDHRADEYSKSALEKALYESQQKVVEVEERESLRRWAMVTSQGEEAKDVMGVQSYGSRGPIAERHRKVFIRKEDGTTTISGPLLCNNTAYINEVKALIRDFPKAPYAYVTLTGCLKYQGDQSWRAEGERARRLLEKLMKVQPHVMEMDSFYGFLVVVIFEEKLEHTGFFQVGKGGVYVPAGGTP